MTKKIQIHEEGEETTNKVGTRKGVEFEGCVGLHISSRKESLFSFDEVWSNKLFKAVGKDLKSPENLIVRFIHCPAYFSIIPLQNAFKAEIDPEVLKSIFNDYHKGTVGN